MPAAVTTLLVTAVAAYAVFCLLLYFTQERLLFYPAPNDPSMLRQWEARRIEISTPESILEGWWTQDEDPVTDFVVLYFGGNAEDVLYALSNAHQLGARKVLAANYRGYGKTRGQPSQAALFADALALYDYVAAQPDISPDRIVVMGRSLGSGVATYVAAHRAVRGVVLITPYDSIAAVAQRKFPFAPVRWLLKHPFPSDRFAPAIDKPVLVIAARHDEVVPPDHARKLYDVWGGPKTFHLLDARHNDVDQHPEYVPLVTHFLKSLRGP